jgi:uncharacterized damage-inducible protein DinB
MEPEIFRVHLAYKEWQVKRLLAAVRELPADVFEQSRASSHGGIKGTLQHIYGADFVWMRRVQGMSLTRADVVIPGTLAELEQQWMKLMGEWRAWASTVPDSDWNKTIEYTMFDGSRRSNPIWQVLLHVVNHGTLHGGQVVTMLRQAGVTPPQLDIIFFYRETDGTAASA